MKKKFQAFNFTVIPNNAASNKTIDIYIDGSIIDAETQAIYQEYYGDTTSVSYKSFRDQLVSSDANVYNVYINSPGGLVTDAMAIHDLLASFISKGKTVNTEGRGLVASAATFILMASPEPKMSANSMLMIHSVSGFAMGNVDEIEQQAKVLRQFNDRVTNFYHQKTGLSMATLGDMMKEETWMSAEDAKMKGFINAVTGEATITNAIRKENWFFNNMAVLNAYNQQVVAPPAIPNNNFLDQKFEEMKKFWQNLQDTIINSINGKSATGGGTDSTATAPTAPTAPTAEAVATAIKDGFLASEQAFYDELDLQVRNQFNDLIKDIDKNKSFTEAVNTAANTAVTAAIGTLNLATKEDVKVVSDAVGKIEVQRQGKASTDTTGADATNRKTFGRWQ